MSPGLQEAALQEDAQQQPQHRGGRGWADGGKERMNFGSTLNAYTYVHIYTYIYIIYIYHIYISYIDIYIYISCHIYIMSYIYISPYIILHHISSLYILI